MTPELILLLAAAMVALALVSLIVRREHVDEAPYLALLAADLAVLGWAHATGRYESMAAFVAEGVAAVLTFGPRVLDWLERRAVAVERLSLAMRVARLRELVKPGRASLRQRRHLEDLVDVRRGRAQLVVERLRAEIAETEDARAALALHEELATALFLDLRFDEGVQHFERHLGLEQAARRPRLSAYLLRAYGELGELGKAAQVMALVEEGPAARDPLLGGLLLEARLVFLAFTGSRGAVDALLADGPASGLPERAKEFLRQVAKTRAELPVPDEARALADKIFQRAIAPQPRPRRRAPVTALLVIANVLALACAQQLIAGSDELRLIRAGGLFRPAVLGGEWWRAATAMFLHASFLHLAVNMYGLYLLGRFTEDLFGPSRFWLVYLLGGLAGAAGSTLVGAGALSVGASGAIMGLLGALIVTLVLRRGTWPEAWRRTLLVNLMLLGGLQIYIGFQVPMIDNAAHVGGMLGGAVAALVLAPGGLVGEGRAARASLRVLAIVAALGVTAAAAQTARTPLERTLARVKLRPVELGGVKLEVPSYWELDVEHGRAEDPYLELRVAASLADGRPRVEAAPADAPFAAALYDRIRSSAQPAAARAAP
ncbi:MAG TPA: rhomboid family intramembrane serine protease [Polyangia bacterium]|nr:rhomboid family intramembrane serine protease [Polyangia bacterium]